jgi:hypothetical protein
MSETERDLERRLKSEQEELFKFHRINERLMTECDQYHYERDVAVETLHKCYAATGEDAGDIGDFIALVDREKHTVNAVREMRKECDQWRECAERFSEYFLTNMDPDSEETYRWLRGVIADFKRLKEAQ